MRNTARRLVLAAALATPITLHAAAQSSPAPASPAPSDAPAWITRSDRHPRLLEIDFPGGSLGEYLRGLKRAEPDGAPELVMTSDVDLVQMPPLKLSGVTAVTALNIPARLLAGVGFDSIGGSAVQMSATGEAVHEKWVSVVHVAPNAVPNDARQDAGARFDLSFNGGSVGEYVAAIRSAQPDANIVLMPDAAAFPMPPVALRAVTVQAAVNAIDREVTGPDGGSSWIHSRAVSNTPEAVYQVVAGSKSARPNETQVISIAALLDRNVQRPLRIEDVLAAIDAATGVAQPKPAIRYHAETSLLIFNGTQQQVDTLHRTLEALRESTHVVVE